MINIENMTVVLEAIKKNKDKFDYSEYINVVDENGKHSWTSLTGKELANTCGTTACVAGWTCILFYPDTIITDIPGNYGRRAAEILGLYSSQEEFLFHMASTVANVDDAIARLEWLIAGKDILEYDIRKESWYEKHKDNEFHTSSTMRLLMERAAFLEKEEVQ